MQQMKRSGREGGIHKGGGRIEDEPRKKKKAASSLFSRVSPPLLARMEEAEKVRQRLSLTLERASERASARPPMQPFLGDRSLLLLSRGLLFLLPPSPKSCLFAYVRVPSFLVCAQPFVRTCLDRSSVESRNFGKDEEADGRKRDWKERKKGKCITEIRLEWRERERLSGRPNCDKKE